MDMLYYRCTTLGTPPVGVPPLYMAACYPGLHVPATTFEQESGGFQG